MTSNNITINREYKFEVATITDAEILQFVSYVQNFFNIAIAELNIIITDADYIQKLNQRYRKKNTATNILSFAYETQPLIGELIICAAIMVTESKFYNISLAEHWQHILCHGILHLLGYDHETEPEAKIMQALEIKLLTSLGIANPYE